MAQKFLDAAQVAALGEEMRREGMAQGVRRGAVGQAQGAAQLLDRELDDARRKRAAARADEERSLRRNRVGAERAGIPPLPRWIGGITGTLRILPPLPVTVTESIPLTGASRRCRPSASEMRRPAP